MTPIDAFAKLKRNGAFTEHNNVFWYWHTIGNGYKIMASRDLNGDDRPILYREFHVTDSPPSLCKGIKNI